MEKDPIQARVQVLAKTMERYVRESEAVHGAIDRDDVDLWDLFPYKAALELWGKLRILTIDPLGGSTAEQKLTFEGLHKKYIAGDEEFGNVVIKKE